ncbi:unnamed protein product [Anisakis simplex]|uniref:Fibronectin type-III domain-containing protein n=1 Tax=Anisakis simplex TaxID=6269 RepID=A0A0M3JZM2_ANISI|nr:unnamed protein product [Anisakis simplex]
MLIVAFINRLLFILLILCDHQLRAIANPLLSIDQLQWNSVHRNLFGADTVYLPNCIYSCKYLNGSSHLNYSTGNDCLCQCADSNPVFLPSVRSCVTKLDFLNLRCQLIQKISAHLLCLPVKAPSHSLISHENERIMKYENLIRICVNIFTEECKRQVAFQVENHFSKWIPTLSLPSTNNILAPSKPILWKDFTQSVQLQWKGNEYDARLLEGTIVQLKLNCYNPNNTSLCLAFRIAGVHSKLNCFCIFLVNLKSTTESGDHQWEHIELITCILLSILLALTVFGSVTLWSVCWRIKKGKLISKIQLQFLYHMKQQQQYMQEQIAVIKANCALYAVNDPNVEHLSSYNGIQKRKLYFSADFFEPEQMANPPQLAQQFVVELRKMIETAKERIRLKRHIPTLSTINEEELENGECLEIKAQNSLNSLQRSDEPSPKSSKSADSGCDSMSDDDTANAVEASSHTTSRASEHQFKTEDECAHAVQSTTSVSSLHASLTPETLVTLTADNIPVVTTSANLTAKSTIDNKTAKSANVIETAESAIDSEAIMSTKNADAVSDHPVNSTKFSFSSRIPKITYPRIVPPVSSSALPPIPPKPRLPNGILRSTLSNDLIPNGGLENTEHMKFRDRTFEIKPQKSLNDPPSLQSILNHLPPPLPDTEPPDDSADQQSVTQKNDTTASERSPIKNSNKIRTTTTYAVFPSDKMRKKSLPRRSKKLPSVLMISSSIESSM